MGGGLNLRGYSGYLAIEPNADGKYVQTYVGTSGASINTELEFHKTLLLKNKTNSKRIFLLMQV